MTPTDEHLQINQKMKYLAANKLEVQLTENDHYTAPANAEPKS